MRVSRLLLPVAAATVLLFVGLAIGCQVAQAHPLLSKSQVRVAKRDVPAPAAKWGQMVNRYWSRWLWKYKHRRLTVAELHKALLIVWRESNGQPREVNGSSGCAGLFQLLPAHSQGKYDLLNPKTNCSLAGMLYVRLGWRPWAATAW
jgi:hypothetical protein